MTTKRKVQSEVVKELLLWENVKKSQYQDDLDGRLLMLVEDIKEKVTIESGPFSSKKDEIDYQELQKIVTEKIGEIKRNASLMTAKMDKLQLSIISSNHTDRLEYVRSKNQEMLLQAEFLMRHKPKEFEENISANYSFYTKLELAERARRVQVCYNIVDYLEKIRDAIEK